MLFHIFSNIARGMAAKVKLSNRDEFIEFIKWIYWDKTVNLTQSRVRRKTVFYSRKNSLFKCVIGLSVSVIDSVEIKRQYKCWMNTLCLLLLLCLLLFLSVSVSLSPSHCVSLFLSIFVSHRLFVTLSLRHCLSPSLCISLFLSISVSHCPCFLFFLSVSVSVSHYLFVFQSSSSSLSISFSHKYRLTWIYIYIYISKKEYETKKNILKEEANGLDWNIYYNFSLPLLLVISETRDETEGNEIAFFFFFFFFLIKIVSF